MDAKRIRLAAQKTQIQVAALAGVAEVSVRLFEANPEAVARGTRAKLQPVYAALAATPVEEDEQ